MRTARLVRHPLLLAALAAVLGIGLVAAPASPALTRAEAASLKRPTGLKAVDVAGNGIAVSWKAVAGAPAYRVQFSTKKSMGSAQTMDVDTNRIEWTYLNPEPSKNSGRLKPGATYYFRVKAITKVDLDHQARTLSSYSATLKVKTPKAGNDRYLKPAQLRSTPRSATSLYVSWNSGGPGINYLVTYGTSASFTGARTRVFEHSGGILDGLSPNTTYYWRVQVISKARAALSGNSATATAKTGAVASAAIRLASYNICGNACGNWDGRSPGILASLVEQAPDLVALQESTNAGDLIADFNTRTDRNLRLVSGSKNANLAYDADRFSVVDEGVRPWSVDGSKNAVWAVLADQSDAGRKLLVVSVHLTNSDSGSAQSKRKAEAKELVALVADHDENGTLPVVIGGDFNVSKRKADHPTVYSTLTRARLIDPLGNPSDSRYISTAERIADHRIDTVYASANQFFRHAPRAKWPNGYDVDYIWGNSRVVVDMFQVVVDLNTKGDFVGTIPSDHNMLVASFHLK